MEERYNNRQIEKMMKDITDDVKSHIDLKVEPLTKQVTYTNGRVRFTEKMIYLAVGALFFVTPTITWLLMDYLEFKQQYTKEIQTAIDTTLQNYRFEVTQ